MASFLVLNLNVIYGVLPNQNVCQSTVPLEGTAFSRPNLMHIRTPNVSACAEACCDYPACGAYTFTSQDPNSFPKGDNCSHGAPYCFFKTTSHAPYKLANCTSGEIVRSPPPTPHSGGSCEGLGRYSTTLLNYNAPIPGPLCSLPTDLLSWVTKRGPQRGDAMGWRQDRADVIGHATHSHSALSTAASPSRPMSRTPLTYGETTGEQSTCLCTKTALVVPHTLSTRDTGHSWSFNPDSPAYPYTVVYEDGLTLLCSNREEPKVLLDPSGQYPTMLINVCRLASSHLPNTAPTSAFPKGEAQYVTEVVMQPIGGGG